MTKLKEQLSLYEQDSQDKAATIAELRKELEERREQYREDSRSKDATIAELRKEKKERFAKYRQDLRDKNETIQLLSKEKKDAIKAQRELSRMISLQQTKREEEKPPRVTKKGKRLNRKVKDLEKKLHNMKAVYEYKLETLHTWKKGLEADLAASHKLINEQMSLIDRLQSEKENITKEPSLC